MDQCLFFEKGEFGVDQLAGCLLNPLTGYGLLSTRRVNGLEEAGVVQTAAASDLGKFLTRKCLKENIPLLNIVRREEQELELKDLGAELILDQTDPDFEKSLKKLAFEFNLKTAFESVAGEMTAQIFNNLPPESVVYLLGSLSLKLVQGINPKALIFDQKQLKGFHLHHTYLKQRPLEEVISEATQTFQHTFHQDLKAGTIRTSTSLLQNSTL